MIDPGKILDQLVRSGAAQGFAGGLAGGVLANALAGKKGRKLAGSAMKVGGLALVGGLAYKAWQAHQRSARGVATPPIGEPEPLPQPGVAFLPRQDDIAETSALSLLIARALISAAKADGQIDTRESQAILNQINASELSAEDKAFLFEEYGRPIDITALVRDVDTPEHAAEVYTASVLIVDPPSVAEKIYLDSLASALGLDRGLVAQIHQTLETAR